MAPSQVSQQSLVGWREKHGSLFVSEYSRNKSSVTSTNRLQCLTLIFITWVLDSLTGFKAAIYLVDLSSMCFTVLINAMGHIKVAFQRVKFKINFLNFGGSLHHLICVWCGGLCSLLRLLLILSLLLRIQSYCHHIFDVIQNENLLGMIFFDLVSHKFWCERCKIECGTFKHRLTFLFLVLNTTNPYTHI